MPSAYPLPLTFSNVSYAYTGTEGIRSPYTSTMVLEDERNHKLRDALVRLSIQLRPIDSPPTVIPIDTVSGFKSIANDQLLQHHRIAIEIRHPKSPNKALWRRGCTIARGSVANVTLAVEIANLNSRIRKFIDSQLRSNRE